MEEKIIDEFRELACKAQLARNALASASIDATSEDLVEYEPFEAEWVQGIVSVTESRLPTQAMFGFEVVGLSTAENAYAMELSEWFDHYRDTVGQQGFACSLSESTSGQFDKDMAASFVLSEKSNIGAQSEHLIVVSSVSPAGMHLPEEFISFCLEHDLIGHLEVATNLINRCFPSVERAALSLEHDPDTTDEWLIIEFEIAADISEILDKYDQLTDLWVSIVPWPARGKIRFSYVVL